MPFARSTRACRRLGVSALTLYAFSEQNWDRPPDRSRSAHGAASRVPRETERSEILDNNIRLRAVGRIERLPRTVRDGARPLAEESKNNTGMTLTLALSYGGREEIADAAAKALGAAVAAGTAAGERHRRSEARSRCMPSMDVGEQWDLLIRTGGEQRISNFLLWGAATPSCTSVQDALARLRHAEDLYQADLCAYQQRERRFGRVPDADEADDALIIDLVDRGIVA
jgi:undecaprenyl diphosphate synthase